MKSTTKKQVRRARRKRRVRKKVTGTDQRPRLTVFRSHQNIYAQIIDDTAGTTLVAASTLESPLKEQVDRGGNKDAAKQVGSALAAKATEAGIKRVVFDRNGYPYHGRIRDLAEAAREGGLEF
jgi:large subunit ribosomal protein L18